MYKYPLCEGNRQGWAVSHLHRSIRRAGHRSWFHGRNKSLRGGTRCGNRLWLEKCLKGCFYNSCTCVDMLIHLYASHFTGSAIVRGGGGWGESGGLSLVPYTKRNRRKKYPKLLNIFSNIHQIERNVNVFFYLFHFSIDQYN